MKNKQHQSKGKAKKVSTKGYSWGDIPGFEKAINGKEEKREGKEEKVWNIIFLYILTFGLFSILVAALFDLQIVKGKDFSSLAQNNRIKEEVIFADRGVMLDRYGTQLVINEPSFHVVFNTKDAPRMISPEEWTKLYKIIYEDEDLKKVRGNLPEQLPLPELTDDGQRYFFSLAKLLEVDEKILIETFIEGVGISNLKKVVLKKDVTRDQQLKIKARVDEFPGIEIMEISDRNYVYKNLFTHIIGYTGEASDSVIEQRADISQGDIVGKTGLEYYYDETVRGSKGIKLVEQDVKGRTVREFVSLETEPKTGNNLHLTIDSNTQKKLRDILLKGIEDYDATGASAILEDAQSGEIVAMVSLPDYDANSFVGGISYEDFNKLNNDPQLPLFNRAVSTAVAPGSAYKTIVAAAALEDGAIHENTYFTSTGVMYLGNQAFPEFGGKAWGRLNLIDGIAYSSNHYFCRTMLALGIENFVPYAQWAGFGSKTGIDLPGEAEGLIPSPENKLKLSASRPWLEPYWNDQGDDCNSAIGQGITLVTPIQMVNWAATIGNGGYVLQPHLVRKIETTKGDLIKQFGREILRDPLVSAKNLALVRKGMRETVTRRIVWPLDGAKVNTAAKTGTAQFGARNSQGEYTQNHAWVITIFPYEKPKYSMVVFLESGFASNNAAKLAREFIDWYADYDKSDL